MTELELIRWIRRQPGVAGVGNDCAVLPGTRPGESLVLKTDQFIEGTHFLRDTWPARTTGAAALARVLSDLAAAGAEPRHCLLSLALPRDTPAAWTRAFFQGFLGVARAHRVPLNGGDLSHAPIIYADVAIAGSVPAGKALTRSGAKPGDGIYVSGSLGGAAVALREGKPFLPVPRLALGRYLRGRATACMDLSDGLSIDLYRLCIESGVSAVLDRPLPSAPRATLDDVLHGGEDYELLFTSRRAPARHAGVEITRIGAVCTPRRKAGEVTFFGQPLRPMGYDHFR
ncbi:MAG: thiamine-phosphate kinase [Bryobacteraceae bacterium]